MSEELTKAKAELPNVSNLFSSVEMSEQDNLSAKQLLTTWGYDYSQTTSTSDLTRHVYIPSQTTSTGDVPYGAYSPTTYTTFTMPLTELDCPLPEDVLEKLVFLGMHKSRKVLKQKLMELFQTWCKTQKIPVAAIPVILVAAMAALDMDTEEKKNLEKEEEKDGNV
jgi:hypothetical protein